MTKTLLPAFLALLMLFAFTACDDDDDDINSRACTEEDVEIIVAINAACKEAKEAKEVKVYDYYTVSYSGTTATTENWTFKTYTCTVTSALDESDIRVTIKSGSTINIEYYSNSYSVEKTWNINATVYGTSHSLYLKATYDEDDEPTSLKIELDGVELTELDDLYSVPLQPDRIF